MSSSQQVELVELGNVGFEREVSAGELELLDKIGGAGGQHAPSVLHQGEADSCDEVACRAAGEIFSAILISRVVAKSARAWSRGGAWAINILLSTRPGSFLFWRSFRSMRQIEAQRRKTSIDGRSCG